MGDNEDMSSGGITESQAPEAVDTYSNLESGSLSKKGETKDE